MPHPELIGMRKAPTLLQHGGPLVPLARPVHYSGAGRQPHDWNRPDPIGSFLVRVPAFVKAIHRECVQPITVSTLGLTGHKWPTTPSNMQLASRMGDQVVIPSGVAFAAILRRNENDAVPVGEVCEWCLTSLAASRTCRCQYDGW